MDDIGQKSGHLMLITPERVFYAGLLGRSAVACQLFALRRLQPRRRWRRCIGTPVHQVSRPSNGNRNAGDFDFEYGDGDQDDGQRHQKPHATHGNPADVHIAELEASFEVFGVDAGG